MEMFLNGRTVPMFHSISDPKVIRQIYDARPKACACGRVNCREEHETLEENGMHVEQR